jgi:hypothetical protein
VFELEVPTETGPEVIRGRVIGELRPTIQTHFDTVVPAVLERTVTTEADLQERINYRLIAIGREADYPLLAETIQTQEEPRRQLPPGGH